MPSPMLRNVYLAASTGELGHYLKAHPEFVSIDVVEILKDNQRQGLEAGDLRSARLSAVAAAEILFALGEVKGAVTTLANLLQERLRLAHPDEDYVALRIQACDLAVTSGDHNWHDGVAFTWTMAAECAYVAARQRGEHGRDLLLIALRDVVDILELVAERPVEDDRLSPLSRLGVLLKAVTEEIRGADWDMVDILPISRLLQRAARAAYSAFPTGSGSTPDDPDEVRLVDESLRVHPGEHLALRKARAALPKAGA
jgi:hypothetical protein